MEYKDHWKQEVLFGALTIPTIFQTEDKRYWPAFRGLRSPLNTRAMTIANGSKAPLEAYAGCQGLG